MLPQDDLKEIIISGELETSYKLDRIKKLLKYLGDPQENVRVIHIAGTSGKTSTAYLITSILKSCGLKVGLSVSPHIADVRERFQINLEQLDDTQYKTELSHFIGKVKQSGVKPTYFEFYVAFAYSLFAEKKLDVAVMEVGVGGLLDGTNVVKRSDKICVICDIGLDHTRLLGKNIEEIAAQKAGIIKPGNTVLMNAQSSEVMEVIKKTAQKNNARLIINTPPEKSDLKYDKFAKNMQIGRERNLSLALMACKVLEDEGLIKVDEGAIKKARYMIIPGRFELFEIGGKTLVLDGAHNPQKLEFFIEKLKSEFGDKSIASLFALNQNKSEFGEAMLKEISSVSSHLILTSFNGNQDFVQKSVDPDQLNPNTPNAEVISNLPAAFEQLLKRNEEVLVVTGSLYLVAQVKTLLQEKL